MTSKPAAPRLRFPVSPWAHYDVTTVFGAHGVNYQSNGRPIVDGLGRDVFHTGLDLNINAPWGIAGAGADRDLGAPVYSIAAGRCLFAGELPGNSWGNAVVIEHPAYGVLTRYAHLSAVDVRPGALVAAGQRIGAVGKGYDSRWPAHLHFDVLTGRPVGGWADWPGNDQSRLHRDYADPLRFFAKFGAADAAQTPWAGIS